MLIELWRNATVREGFERGRSLKEISEETGLSQEEVLQREVELHLFSVARDIRVALAAESHVRGVRLREDPDR